MKQIKIYFLIGVFCLTSFKCDDTDVDPITKGLEIKLVVLDVSGNETYEFISPETDFTLMLKAINNTDEEIDLTYYNYCALVYDENFLMVYKKGNENIAMGRPYPKGVECAAINYRTVVPPNGFYYLTGGRWLDNPENSRFTPGTYFSEYNINIEGNEFYTYVEFFIK